VRARNSIDRQRPRHHPSRLRSPDPGRSGHPQRAPRNIPPPLVGGYGMHTSRRIRIRHSPAPCGRGPGGGVRARQRARQSCARSSKNIGTWPQVPMIHGDALAQPFDPADGITVNAGATHPPAAWLDGLAPRRPPAPAAHDRRGLALLRPREDRPPRRRVPDSARLPRHPRPLAVPGRHSPPAPAPATRPPTPRSAAPSSAAAFHASASRRYLATLGASHSTPTRARRLNARHWPRPSARSDIQA